MDERFHKAQAALAEGSVKRLIALLAADPELASARSGCSHPTILQCLVLTMPPVDSLEDLIDLLADHGAELTDPLIAAAGIDNVRAVAKLLDLGARVDGNGRWSPLEEALYWVNPAAVSLLLERGASVPSLRAAAALGDLERVALCFDETGKLTPAAGEIAWPFGASIPEAVRHDPRQVIGNALVYAAAWGRVEALEALLARGADVNMIPAGFDFAGTPLHYAALEGRSETVDRLLELGADPSLPDAKIGKLPEDWADHGGHHGLADKLGQVRLRVPDEGVTAVEPPALLLTKSEGVVRLTINRPQKRNALSRALLGELEKVLSKVAADAEARVVVIAAEGPAFSAGHDLAEMSGRTEDEYRDLFEACSRVMLGLRRLPQPVIARVQGVATAAGCQLVAACDLAVASSEATFATPGVKIGLFCTTPMVPLVRAVPAKAAMEMLLTGRPISAQRALELGLVNRVVPPEQLDAEVERLTADILESSAPVLGLGKQAFHALQDLPEDEAYRRAVDVMTDNALRHDAQEGIAAFLQKRRPTWTGR